MTTTDYPPRHIKGFRPLVPGEQWHRTDWTTDMLPDGWRPLMLGEIEKTGDQMWNAECGLWNHRPSGIETGGLAFHRRTRRHLPPPPPPPTFEHDGKIWRSHVPGDPCPVDGSVLVDVLLFYSISGYASHQDAARNWKWSDETRVIGYRLADEQPEVAALKARVAELEQELTAALTPRPIAEASELREWFVRLYGQLDDGAVFTANKWSDDTHFIDIRLPQPTEREQFEAEFAKHGNDPFALWKAQKGGAK